MPNSLFASMPPNLRVSDNPVRGRNVQISYDEYEDICHGILEIEPPKRILIIDGWSRQIKIAAEQVLAHVDTTGNKWRRNIGKKLAAIARETRTKISYRSGQRYYNYGEAQKGYRKAVLQDLVEDSHRA